MIQYFVNKNKEEDRLLYACLNCSDTSWAETYVVKFQSPFKSANIDVNWGNTKYVQKDRLEIANFIVNTCPKIMNASFEWEPINEEQLKQSFTDEEMNTLCANVRQYIKLHIKKQENENKK